MAGRRRTGQGRMDAAVDHFAPMGYDKADVRRVINGLLKNVYGKNGWPLLEDNCYHVVQEALFEKQEEEEKLQLQQQEEEEPQVVQEALFEEQEQEEMLQLQLQEEEEPQNVQEEQQQWEEGDEDQQQEAAIMVASSEIDMPIAEVRDEVPCQAVLAVLQDQEQEEGEWDDDEDQDQQQDAAMMGAPSEIDMPIVEVYDEVPCETALAVQQTEEEVVPMIVDPPAPEAASPHPEATGTGRTRRPCYGWISESESDSDYEEFLASRKSSCISLVQEEAFLKGSGSVGGM